LIPFHLSFFEEVGMDALPELRGVNPDDIIDAGIVVGGPSEDVCADFLLWHDSSGVDQNAV
jgi:hypothetical protein